MKKINKFILTSLLLVTAGVSVSMAAACSNDENLPEPADRGNWTVSSPDKTLKSDITMNGNGELSYTVKKGDVTVIEKSDLEAMKIFRESTLKSNIRVTNSR